MIEDVVDPAVSNERVDDDQALEDDLRSGGNVSEAGFHLLQSSLTRLLGSLSLPDSARQMSWSDPSWPKELAMIGSMYFAFGEPGLGLVACLISLSKLAGGM